ncbi:MAG TPA: potassium-transporting ATPase subunit KdpC [Blastococcus sp.]|nr:potassium-transporting ATPase subunit KdpC [Blastococcus sp.]
MIILRQFLAGLRLLLLLTVVLGLAYPLIMTGIGQVALPSRANGSLVRVDGQPVGSALLGQRFAGPQWFTPRPSASGYDGLASGGTNLGPGSPALQAAVAHARAAAASADGVLPGSVPPDAVTASGSGLDPDISPAYAYQQVDRVAAARGLPAASVRRLVAAHVTGRALGFLGEPHVNVLELDVALAALPGRR